MSAANFESHSTGTSSGGSKPRGQLISKCVVGYCGHLPGCPQTVSTCFAMQKKVSVGLLNSERAPPPQCSHPTDKWGNPTFQTSAAFKNHLTALYLNAHDPSGRAMEDFQASLEHTERMHRAETKLPAIRNPILAQCAMPPAKKAERVVPPKVVGWTGYRPGIQSTFGKSINVEYFEDMSHADYLPRSELRRLDAADR